VEVPSTRKSDSRRKGSIEELHGADKGLRTFLQCSESRIKLILKERFDKKNLIVPGKVALLVIYVERGSRHGLDYLHFDLAPGRILHAMTG
jgi:hypothetical protein